MGDTAGYLNGDMDRMIEATLTARAGEAASV
jgi:hypothetical protein